MGARDNSKLSIKDLTRKLVVLFLILGARRRQPIVAIQANFALIEDDKSVLLPTVPLKHTRPGKRLFEYDASLENRKLCIVDCTREYVLRRSAKVDESVTSFIITHGKYSPPQSRSFVHLLPLLPESRTSERLCQVRDVSEDILCISKDIVSLKAKSQWIPAITKLV